MSKTAFDSPRLTGFMMAPEDLVLVEDQQSDLWDPRVKVDPPEPFILNVLALGVQETISVRKRADGKAEVIDGRKRTLAAREVNKRLVAAGSDPRLVPVLVKKAEAADPVALMYALNEARVEDDALTRAGKMARYIALGHSEEQTAVTFACAASSVRAHLKLLDMPKEVKAAVSAGRLSLSAAPKAAQLPAEELAEVLSEKAAEPVIGGKKDPGRVTVAEVSRRAKPAGPSAPGKKEIKEALKLRTLPPAAKAALEWVLTGEWDADELELALETDDKPVIFP
jgi:ParB-like chromosome segregation protein Spo0J